jgi:hypothetical protein
MQLMRIGKANMSVVQYLCFYYQLVLEYQKRSSVTSRGRSDPCKPVNCLSCKARCGRKHGRPKIEIFFLINWIFCETNLRSGVNEIGAKLAQISVKEVQHGAKEI